MNCFAEIPTLKRSGLNAIHLDGLFLSDELIAEVLDHYRSIETIEQAELHFQSFISAHPELLLDSGYFYKKNQFDERRCERMSKIELLAPAGDLQRAKTAIRYGADAVYLGGKRFSLRSRASNFDIPDIAEAVAFATLPQRKDLRNGQYHSA